MNNFWKWEERDREEKKIKMFYDSLFQHGNGFLGRKREKDRRKFIFEEKF